MAVNGNKPLEKRKIIGDNEIIHCLCCDKEVKGKELYNSDSDLHKSVGKIPYCKECLDKFYEHYYKEYKKLEYNNPDRKAVERLCMALDIYYHDDIFDSVKNKYGKIEESELTLFSYYLKQSKLYQYRNKNYNTTIHDKYKAMKDENASLSVYTMQDAKVSKDVETATKLFGSGFSNDDYIFLYDQYSDWTARHECQTKAQEEVFKQICFIQLEILKAQRAKQDTKDLVATFQKLLETAKLQPKQNKGDTVSETQTFGTLIDKWENTRPTPEIDEELQDVDRIGKYINIFFKGHLCKMMGIKNSFCKAYDDFMKKYSVEKPEYESEDYDSEALFDAVFGGDLDD